jgi:hypothetical protein
MRSLDGIISIGHPTSEQRPSSGCFHSSTAINRNAWSQSIGIAGRDHPVRAAGCWSPAWSARRQRETRRGPAPNSRCRCARRGVRPQCRLSPSKREFEEDLLLFLGFTLRGPTKSLIGTVPELIALGHRLAPDARTPSAALNYAEIRFLDQESSEPGWARAHSWREAKHTAG